MQSRRSFFGLMGGLAALVPGMSWARGAELTSEEALPDVGEFYSCTFDTEFLELPPAVLVHEWWDDGAVLPRTRTTELGGKRLAQLLTESLGVRRLHVWTTEDVFVYFDAASPKRRIIVPLVEGGGHEALSKWAWGLHDTIQSGEFGPHGGLTWVTVGSHKGVRHGMAWLPIPPSESLTSHLGLGLSARAAGGGIKLVGDGLSPEEKSMLTGQSLVGDLHLDGRGVV